MEYYDDADVTTAMDDFQRLLKKWDRKHNRTCQDNWKCKDLKLTGVSESARWLSSRFSGSSS